MSAKLPCPNSYLAGAAGEDRVHYVSQAELDANGGVCAKCRERFKKRFQSQSARRHETEHYEFAQGVAFVGDHAEPMVEPEDVDFSIHDGELQENGLDKTAVMAIAKFCLRLFEIGGRNKEKFFEAAHAFCFAAHIHPEQQLSGEGIVRKYFKNPKTKQAFFKQVNRFRDILNLPRIAGAKNNEARQTYRRRMKESHDQRKQHRGAKAGKTNGAFARIFGPAFKGTGRAN